MKTTWQEQERIEQQDKQDEENVAPVEVIDYGNGE